jgi:anti-anti-sigma regulatory factor
MGTSAFRDSFDYSIEPSPDGDTLRVHGEVNFMTAEKFHGLLQGFVGDKRHATVDLRGVTLMNIQGLQALEEASRSRTIRLRATRFIWHMLGVLRLRDRFERLAD